MKKLGRQRRRSLILFLMTILTRLLFCVLLGGLHVPVQLVVAQEEENEKDELFSGDAIEDSMFDPIQADPSCGSEDDDCYAPPKSTIQTETLIDATCLKGPGDDLDASKKTEEFCSSSEQQEVVDLHWGRDPKTLKIRDLLRDQAKEPLRDSRPPIFLLPGLASTRLVAWKLKKCPGMFGSDIRVQDNVWLNINLVIQMGTVNVDCMKECLKLGLNQSDADDWDLGCKLRPDEGLDSIASLAPGGIGSSLLVGGTNTVYAWLIQWLADNLGYDVTNILGLPYDWRLSPDKMEARDGFLSMTRRRIEAAVASNGQPGIMVAHSMGNSVFRYFLEWLRVQMRQEAYDDYVYRARRRAESLKKADQLQRPASNPPQPPAPPTTTEEIGDTTAKSDLTGWLVSAVPVMDQVLDWWTTQKQVNNRDAQTEELTHDGASNEEQHGPSDDDETLEDRLWQLAVDEGDTKWLEWLEKHLWTYVGLSAPMLGAVNPLRAVISGENMGLPINDDVARDMEVTFGSTHTINPVSTSTGFCDERVHDDWGDESLKDSFVPDEKFRRSKNRGNLACLDDIVNDIELSSATRDPWKNFPALKALMRDRIDWDTGKPMIRIDVEHCNSVTVCEQKDQVFVGPKDVESGRVFDIFNQYWKEQNEPLITKKKQLEDSFINSKVTNTLNNTWERPLIKHIIMAYGVDYPTEVGYLYKKQYRVDQNGDIIGEKNRTDGLPDLKQVLWEEARGQMRAEVIEAPRGSIAEHFIKKKNRKVSFSSGDAILSRGGDGSVPYISLSWVHTWLLHAARARRFSEEDRVTTDQKNALDHIHISHRPNGGHEWNYGPPPESLRLVDPGERDGSSTDTGTDHPHGTQYKPDMTRYHNIGVSRTTGIEYTTTVIEAKGVEHKEATRNYDILAAVFRDVVNYMHDDLGLVSDDSDERDEEDEK